MKRYSCQLIAHALWAGCLAIMLVYATAYADSPPNLSTNIPWTDSGGVGNAANFGGVDDIEMAFNLARRAEEAQLGLADGQLGVLDLPSQAQWDALNTDQRALLLLNAERQARAGSAPQVIGLPLAGIETNLDQVAQDYADLLVSSNTFGHFQPSGDPNVDNPTNRIANAPVIQKCSTFLARAENLAAFYTSQASNRLPLERAIYNWIYVDASSNWGHRAAALLQDKEVDGTPAGYTNDLGDAAHEGFLGIGQAGAAGYDPNNFGLAYGEIIVLNIFDPTPAADCPTDADRSQLEVTISASPASTLAVDEIISLTAQITNVGATLLTNVALTHTYDISTLTWLTTSLAADVNDPIAGQFVWEQVEQAYAAPFLSPGETLTLTVQFLANAPTAPANKTIAAMQATAHGGWGGSTAPQRADSPITILSVLARPDTATTPEDEPVTMNVLANDSPGLVIDGVGGAAHGATALVASTIVYTPANDFFGVDTFNYTASKAGNVTTSQVTVTVTAVNDAPVFVSTPLDLIETGIVYEYAVQTLDPDPNDSVHITLAEGPQWLTLVDHGDGTATLSADPQEIGALFDVVNVVLVVTDADGAKTEQSFDLQVAIRQTEFPLFLPLVRL